MAEKIIDHHLPLEIKPGQDNLEIQYAGLSFIKPESMHFKYQLEGLDKDWVDAGNRRAAWNMPDGTLQNPGASERVIAADGTLSNRADRNPNGANFTKIYGGWGGGTKPHSTAHLNPGGIPAGGNVIMLDGHVEWRRFNKMYIRTTGAPSFWW